MSLKRILKHNILLHKRYGKNEGSKMSVLHHSSQ